VPSSHLQRKAGLYKKSSQTEKSVKLRSSLKTSSVIKELKELKPTKKLLLLVNAWLSSLLRKEISTRSHQPVQFLINSMKPHEKNTNLILKNPLLEAMASRCVFLLMNSARNSSKLKISLSSIGQ
jgi:hypothetical protein